MDNEMIKQGEVLLYNNGEEKEFVSVVFKDETFWLTQKSMAELFDVNTQAISKHLSNIYDEEELDKDSTCSKMEQVQIEGNRSVTRTLDFYNLDAIIAVGYRVNSKKATRFRQWATKTLKEYIQKGFVLNDEMMKNGRPFGKDYFDELLERIREIRASERRAYQKKVAIAPFDGIFSAHGMVLRPKTDVIDPDFFPLFISSDYFLDAAISISVGSVVLVCVGTVLLSILAT